jgi:hypothetical protein
MRAANLFSDDWDEQRERPVAAVGATARQGSLYAPRSTPDGIRTEIGLAPEDRDRW